MRAAGLPAGYADALETGLWPSLDVLPPAERAAAGRPIEAGAVLWPTPPHPDPLPQGERGKTEFALLPWREREGPDPQGREGEGETLLWPAAPPLLSKARPLDPLKFRNPIVTANGERRAPSPGDGERRR